MKLSDQEQRSGRDWYPDSGATADITHSESQLQSSEPYAGNDQIMVGNGDFLPISHVGSVDLHTTQGILPLVDVLVCPGIAKSLYQFQNSHQITLVRSHLTLIVCL